MTDSQLFVMDPLADILPDHDTTYVIMREVEARDCEVWWARSVDICWDDGSLFVAAQRVKVRVDDPGNRHFELLEEAHLPINEYDLVWMREDPPFDQQYLASTYLLEHADVPVVNSPEGIRDSNEKLLSLEFPEHLPETWVGASQNQGRKFVESVGGTAVGKTLSGYGGEEVYKLDRDDPNLGSLLSLLTEDGERSIMIQEYLPEVTETGDRRVIVLGGEPIGAISRLPGENDFRSNFHSGGSAGETGVRPVERDICRDLKPELLDRGLHLVGLDVIGDKITEINVTSPTCVQEINRGAGVNLEQQIVDYALKLT